MKLLRGILTLALLAGLSTAIWAGQVAGGKAVTITVLNYNDITSPEAKVGDKVIDAFKKAYPNVTLKIDNLFNEPFHQKTAAMAAAGQLPDVVYMWPGGRSENLIKNGLVQDLFPLLGKDKAAYVPSTMVPQYDGKLLELPIAITATHVFYINKGLLDKNGIKMPKTYADLVKMVPKLKAKNIETVLMANKDTWVNQSCLFSAVVGRLCGEAWLKDAIAGKAKFTEKPFVNSIKFIQQMYKDGVLSANSVQTAYGEVPNLFAAGKGAFLIDGDWRVNAVVPLIPENEQDKIILSVFPKIPGEVVANTTSLVTGTGFGINAATKGDKLEAAWAFVAFNAGAEAAKIRLEDQGVMPAYKIDTKGIKLAPLVVQRINFYPKFAGTPVLDNVIGPKPIEVINNGLQQIALGTVTPEELAAKFEEAVRANK